MSQLQTYFKKPETVEAFRYTEQDPLPEPLYKCHGGIFIETAGDIREVNPGEWIVKDQSGYRVLSPEEFEKQFVA